MGADTSRRRKGNDRGNEKIAGQFLAMPYSVLQSKQYRRLSHTARDLLILVAMQCWGGNNGKAVATPRYMRKFGWTSNDTLTRGLRELTQSGLLCRTRLGRCPNKAAWFAITWTQLNTAPGVDASEFVRFCPEKLVVPPPGTARLRIGPARGAGKRSSVPSHGAISPDKAARAIPSGGDYLALAIYGGAQTEQERQPLSSAGSETCAN